MLGVEGLEHRAMAFFTFGSWVVVLVHVSCSGVVV